MISPSPPPPKVRRFPVWDLIAVLVVLSLITLLSLNVLANMRLAGVSPGFSFLTRSAGFDVSEALIPYASEDSYARVIAVGVLNTLFLSAVCLVLATIFGVTIGLISVGPSPVGRGLARAYVETFRNLPKLLILLVLFVAAVSGLPHVRQSLSLGPFHLSNRSVNFPVPILEARHLWLLAALSIGILLAWLLGRVGARRRCLTGDAPTLWPFALGLILGLPVATSSIFAIPLHWSLPELSGFDFAGGGRVSLQFMVIALTLSMYHGAQIGEVVRGGLEAVSKGQREAAAALGLGPWKVTRLIVLPQALRIVIPPMNNQYANLIKNTSIAIAVGYSDLMSVAGTIINQTFRPLEMMALTMLIYLSICLVVTTGLNRLNERMRRVEGR